MASGAHGVWNGTVRVAGWLYVALLLALAIELYTVGEKWWPGAVLLYSPRVLLLAPLGLLALVSLGRAHRRHLLAQSVLALGLVLAMMGLNLSRPSAATGKRLTILSYNVWYGALGNEGIVREIEAAKPDVVVMQAIGPTIVDYFQNYFSKWQFRHDGEFLLASRFPVLSVEPVKGDQAFAHYSLSTPLGTIDLFNVHPDSPRDAFEEVRGQGLRHLLRDDLSHGEVARLEGDSAHRERQVRELAEAAARAQHAVVIAGDTNLPGGSAIFRRQLACYQDGFSEAGSGFGYTFPANRLWPWMRIDRILVGPGLRVARFGVGTTRGSDHRAVWAELTSGPGRPGGIACAPGR